MARSLRTINVFLKDLFYDALCRIYINLHSKQRRQDPTQNNRRPTTNNYIYMCCCRPLLNLKKFDNESINVSNEYKVMPTDECLQFNHQFLKTF